MANLRLDGILPHNVTTRDDYELTEALVQASELPCTVLTDDEKAVTAGTIYLTFWNPSRREMQVKARFMHDHQVRMEPREIAMNLAPGSDKVVEIAIQSGEAIPADESALLQLDWTMGFDLAAEDDLFLSGTRSIPLRPSSADLIATVAPEFVDSLSVAPAKPDEGFTLRYTTDASTPLTSSPIFAGPFTIDETMTVNARMFNQRGHGTATATQSYKLVPAGTGLRYRFYKGSWTLMPDFSKLTPVFESVATDLNVESRQLRADDWGMVLEGDFKIDKAGEYNFYLTSDDGSKLYIDDRLIIDNDGDHSLLELKGATEMSAGSHKLRIDFFEAGGEAILGLDMEGPGMKRQPFPVEKVSH
jgi:hypothetical protein